MQMLSQKFQDSIDEVCARFEANKGVVERMKTDLVEAKAERRRVVKAQQITQMIAQQVQEKAHSRIAGVVSKCMSAVFDEPYEFLIEFERKRGKTEAHLVFVRDGIRIEKPMAASGGGVVAVAAVALRAACLMLSRSRYRSLLVLDEAFAHLHSAEAQNRVQQMLLELAQETGIQIIMATGAEGLQAGKIVELTP